MDLAKQSEEVKNWKRKKMMKRSTLSSYRLKTKRTVKMKKKSTIPKMTRKTTKMLMTMETKWTRLTKMTLSATSEM